MKTYKELLNEIVKIKDQWKDDPDKPYNQQPRNPTRGAGENIMNAGWHPSSVYDKEEYRKPYISGVQTFVHPREHNHRIMVDYNSMEWEHVDTKKGGNGHVASGRDLKSLQRHMTNWPKLRRS